MLIYLSFNLIAIQIINLSYFQTCRNRLSQHDVQKSKFAVNRSLDGKVLLSMTDHQHVAPHIVEAFLHLENLHAPVEAVLLRPVLHKLKFS